MKYENKQMVNIICEQINSLKNKLEMLTPIPYRSLTVEVLGYNDSISITVDESTRKEDFAPYAKSMIESMKDNLNERISNLYSQLENL